MGVQIKTNTRQKKEINSEGMQELRLNHTKDDNYNDIVTLSLS